jgi:hypothetical protein
VLLVRSFGAPARTRSRSASSVLGETAVKFLWLCVIATIAMTFASQIHAQQIGPAPPGCVKDLSGKISCPPMGGEVYMNLSGEAVCGKGRCARDIYGKITCSSQPAGQIQVDVSGKVMCAGGCEEASPSYCQVLQ